MKKLGIIGASYLQLPLILKAQSLGYETHVFAWEVGDVGESAADVFYPISITEVDEIAEICRGLNLDGICTVASDLGAVTVNYVAHQLGLPGNSLEASYKASNKHASRLAFDQGGDPSPISRLASSVEEGLQIAKELSFPLIVKPTDRSGSRGVSKIYSLEELPQAVAAAMEVGFEKQVVIEEFAEGLEYSVECATQNGQHHLLAITRKFTTGAPHFIETGHIQPSMLSLEIESKIKNVVFHALDSLGITNSISHSEIKIDDEGNIKIIEIGGRMGGDCIGTHLTPLTTGVDFVKCAIDLACGNPLNLEKNSEYKSGTCAFIRFIFSQDDLEVLERIKKERPELIYEIGDIEPLDHEVSDSSSRFGHFILKSNSLEDLKPFFPSTKS